MPKRSPTASAAGIAAQPGCDCDGGWVSSVSSACARIPLASAASIGPQRTDAPATVQIALPLYARTNWIANLPGGSSEPEIMAARVSRIMNFVFSTTGSGSGRVAAPAMNVLSVVMTSLTSAASATSSANSGRNAAVANNAPVDCSNLRRLTLK
jgi:hypothetical protein